MKRGYPGSVEFILGHWWKNANTCLSFLYLNVALPVVCSLQMENAGIDLSDSPCKDPRAPSDPKP